MDKKSNKGKEEQKLYHVKIIGVEYLNPYDKEVVGRHIDNFFERYKKHLGPEPHIQMDIHPHKEQTREVKSYYCKITVTSDLGVFHAERGNIGPAITCDHILKMIEEEIKEKLGRAKNSERKTRKNSL